MQVILIDDDVRTRRMLARLIRTSGIHVIGEAADGQEALDLLERLHPDLIITDGQMPHLDGLGFTRALRDRGDRTPVIMLSGQTDPVAAKRARQAGVDQYLAKPCNPTALFASIHELANASSAA